MVHTLNIIQSTCIASTILPVSVSNMAYTLGNPNFEYNLPNFSSTDSTCGGISYVLLNQATSV